MINILYIDDDINIVLDKYLSKSLELSEDEPIEYESLTFSEEDSYDSLLDNDSVQRANIILIDSKLFENQYIRNRKITGEEFKLILQKFFPFIETLIISQNELEDGIQVIKKYDSACTISSKEYYDEHLKEAIIDAVQRIKQTRLLFEKVNNNSDIDKLVKERIRSSIEGLTNYDNLTTNDIDRLVEMFKSVEETINGRL